MSFSLFLSLEYASSPDFKRALEKTDRRAIKEREREREIDDEREFQHQHVLLLMQMPVGKKRPKYLHTKRIGFG